MTNPVEHAYELLRRTADLAAGLSVEEIRAVEDRFGFRFLAEHRNFLRLHLPTGKGWPDWRAGDPARLADLLARPVTGALFDVRNNDFWPRSWGPRPLDEAAAVTVARRHLEAAPKLVPVHSLRYLPAAPAPSAAPVFSVHQTDVIHYGTDLDDYVVHEFGITGDWSPRRPTVRIPFWSDLADGAEDGDL